MKWQYTLTSLAGPMAAAAAASTITMTTTVTLPCTTTDYGNSPNTLPRHISYPTPGSTPLDPGAQSSHTRHLNSSSAPISVPSSNSSGTTICQQNGCLQTVKTQGTQQCSSFFARIGSASQRTIFVTVTSTTTLSGNLKPETSVVSVESTVTDYGTTTEHVLYTTTDTIVKTDTVTTSSTVTVAASSMVAKRQMTMFPSSPLVTFPSECSSYSAYSSACSCIGVAAPRNGSSQTVVTSTSTVTITQSGSAALMTTTTQPITSVYTTVTQIALNSTETVSTPIATDEVSTTITVTSTTTFTSSVTPTPTFFLVANYVNQPANPNIYGVAVEEEQQVFSITFGSNLSSATPFFLNATTSILTVQGGPVAAEQAFYGAADTDSNSIVLILTPQVGLGAGGEAMKCSISPNVLEITCVFGNAPGILYLCNSEMFIAVQGFDINGGCDNAVEITLSALYLPS